MAPYADYQPVAPNSEALASAHLYAQYRMRLDEETFRRTRENRVIDVAARSVSLEEPRTPRPISAERGAAGGGPDVRRGTAGATRQTAVNDEEEFGGRSAATYRPADMPGLIDLRPAPLARGMFVDLMV